MSRRRLSGLLILAIVSITAGGVYLIQAVEEPRQPTPAPVPVPVEVARVTPRDFTHRLEALGTVQAIREAAVSAKVAGPVARIPPPIALGAGVEQGTLLAEIDPTSYRIDVQRYEALVGRARAQVGARKVDVIRQRALISINRDKLRLAEAEYRRLAALLQEGGVAQQAVDRAEAALRRAQEELERAESGLREAEAQSRAAEADLAGAEAELAQAQEALANTQVRAPFTGLISEKRITLGEHVAPGTVLFRLADIAQVKVLIQISADDVGFLRPGAPADINVRGLPGPLTGRVEHIGPRADLDTRTFPVEVLVDNRGPTRLLPGLFARVGIPVHTYANAILIPRASVLTEGGTPAVFVADPEQGIARRRPITIVRTFGPRHLIDQGLEPGDLLVVTGQRLLRDGAAIRVVETRDLGP